MKLRKKTSTQASENASMGKTAKPSLARRKKCKVIKNQKFLFFNIATANFLLWWKIFGQLTAYATINDQETEGKYTNTTTDLIAKV